MNRRRLAVIALVIAVPLFGTPLVSPVPDYGPHLRVIVNDDPTTFPTEQAKENQLRNTTTMDYQNLSAHAQRLFERGYTTEQFADEPAVRLDEVPESWTTLVPNESDTGRFIYIYKDDEYYYTGFQQFTPGPSLQAFILRLGPLIGAIGFGTLAGYFVLTIED